MNARLYVLYVNPNRFLNRVESLHGETCDRLCHEFGGENGVRSIVEVAYALLPTVDLHSIATHKEGAEPGPAPLP